MSVCPILWTIYLAETIFTKTTEETQENRFCLRPIFSSCNPVDKGEGVISFGTCAKSHCVYTIKYDQTKPIHDKSQCTPPYCNDLLDTLIKELKKSVW